MKNLSVRLKLLLGLAPLLLLVTALAAIAVFSLSALTHRAERLVSVNYILDHLNDIRAAQMAYALTGEPAELQTLGKAQQQIDALIAENLAKMPYPQAQASLPAIRRIMQGYQQTLQHALDSNGRQLPVGIGKQLTAQVAEAIGQVNALISEQNLRSAQELQQRSQLMLGIFLTTVLLAGLVAWLLVRQICSPCSKPWTWPSALAQASCKKARSHTAATNSASCCRHCSAAAPTCGVPCSRSARSVRGCRAPRPR